MLLCICNYLILLFIKYLINVLSYFTFINWFSNLIMNCKCINVIEMLFHSINQNLNILTLIMDFFII